MPLDSWRTSVRDNYVATLGAFQAANPTLVDQVYRARPESVADTRAIFVGGIRETYLLDSGTFTRTVDVDVVCSVHLADNQETQDKLDEMADAVIDWLAADAQAHVLSDHTEQHPVRSEPVELQEGASLFIPAIAITCRATIQQGRA